MVERFQKDKECINIRCKGTGQRKPFGLREKEREIEREREKERERAYVRWMESE